MNSALTDDVGSMPSGDISPFDLCSKLAYVGRVGRERRDWCVNFIQWKESIFTKLSEANHRFERDNAKTISCSKGCISCCSQYIYATLQECDAIVYWLSQHNDTKEIFLANYRVWRNAIRTNHEQMFKDINQVSANTLAGEANSDELKKISKEYHQWNIGCPFLHDGACSIYPVRPLVCAGHASVSPPEQCAPFSKISPEIIHPSLSNIEIPPYFCERADTFISSCAPLMVYEILHGGYAYLDGIPGLTGLLHEVGQDPEFMNILRKSAPNMA